MILNFAPQKIIAALTYRTQSALNGDAAFLERLKYEYPYVGNCVVNDEFHLWHHAGTHYEIAQAVTSIGEIPNGSRVKFPAILDFLPVRELVDGKNITLTFNLAIAASTNTAYNSAQRDKFIFEPLLMPVYREFIHQIGVSGYFLYASEQPRYEMYRCYTTGRYQGAIIDRYSEFIDVVEIRGLQLSLKSNICERDIAEMELDNALILTSVKQLLQD